MSAGRMNTRIVVLSRLLCFPDDVFRLWLLGNGLPAVYRLLYFNICDAKLSTLISPLLGAHSVVFAQHRKHLQLLLNNNYCLYLDV